MTLHTRDVRALLQRAESRAASAVVNFEPSALPCDATSDACFEAVRRVLEADGFAVLDFGETDPRRADAWLEEMFGSNRARDALEIIEPAKGQRSYAGSRRAQPLHTDAGYAATFPLIATLFCERAAERGGLTQLVPARAVWTHLLEARLDLSCLFARDAIRIAKGAASVSKPLMCRSPQGRLGISFSPFVDSIDALRAAEDAILRIADFVSQPSNQIVFPLREGQALVLDNQAVLHGRTSFPEETARRLHRRWFYAPRGFEHLGFSES